MKLFILIFVTSLLPIRIFASLEINRIVVAQDGSGNYKTIQDAINSVPDNQSIRTTIFVKNGTYHEKVFISSSKTNISLIGESADGTVITNSDYNKKIVRNDTIGTWTSYTVAVDGEGFIGKDISFENASGTVGQAVAVRVMADMVVFINCRFLGNQDTLFAHGIGRLYFKNCYIEGTTDFIFGSAVVLFENCRIHSKANSFITAASTPMGNSYGFVFKNCILTAVSGVNKVYLGRPWRMYAKTVFINCTMGSHICSQGWNNWDSPEKEKTVFYAEYQSIGPGGNTDSRVSWSKILSDNEVSEYTISKIFARQSVPIPVTKAWLPITE
jgi:pectinesterase